jgi:hypothetical protein
MTPDEKTYATDVVRQVMEVALMEYGNALRAQGKSLAEIERAIERYADDLVPWARDAMLTIGVRVLLGAPSPSGSKH